MKGLAELRALPARTIAGLVVGHAVLLAGVLWGGVPYVLMQALLALELLAVNVANVFVYRERGWRKHVLDILKLTAALVFVLFFLIVTHGVAKQAGSGNAMATGLQELESLSVGIAGWMLAYIVVHAGVSLWQALRSPNPRRAWAQQSLSGGAVTFIAMFFMVFAGLFLAAPLASGLRTIGFPANVDTLMGGFMIATRFVLSLVAATISPSELDAIAANPYAS